MIDEKELVTRILHGDMKAFSLLVDQYERLVTHVIRRMINNEEDLEDVCQEVFVKVYKFLNGFNFRSKLSTWIARIAYSTAINYLKKYRKGIVEPYASAFDENIEDIETPEGIWDKKELTLYMNKLIANLPEQYRIVLTLFHLEEFSLQEITAITGMPEGTIKSHLFRGRKLLKEKIVIYLQRNYEQE